MGLCNLERIEKGRPELCSGLGTSISDGGLRRDGTSDAEADGRRSSGLRRCCHANRLPGDLVGSFAWPVGGRSQSSFVHHWELGLVCDRTLMPAGAPRVISWQAIGVVSQILVWISLALLWLIKPSDLTTDVTVLKQSQKEQDRRLQYIEDSFRAHVQADDYIHAYGSVCKK